MNERELPLPGSKASSVIQGGRMTKLSRYGWRDDTVPGTLEWIEVDRLVVDHAYQRHIRNEKKVLRLCANFSWVAFGCCIVGRRPDGSLVVITGQHRVEAAKRRGIEKVPCHVHNLSDVRLEAEGFLIEAQEKQPLQSVEKFKTLVLMGDSAAVMVSEMLAAAGRTPANSAGESVIKCISSMLVAARRDPEQLHRCWPVIVDVCAGKSMPERIVEGLIYLDANAAESIATPRWRRRIVQVGQRELLEAAGRACAFYSRGGAKIWAHGFAMAINKGLQRRLTLPPMDTANQPEEASG